MNYNIRVYLHNNFEMMNGKEINVNTATLL